MKNIKKTKGAVILFLLVLSVVLASCATEPQQEQSDGVSFALSDENSQEESEEKKEAQYKKITPKVAKQMMEEDGVIILDVRTQAEYDEVHIKDAVLLPDYEVETRAGEVLPDKDAVILVYCRSGNRSEKAARKLVSLEYTNVYDFGGIIDWPYSELTESS